MSLYQPRPTPAIRAVNQAGVLIAGPAILTPGDPLTATGGIGLLTAPPMQYEPLRSGPDVYMGYSQSPTLYGYRRKCTIGMECYFDDARADWGARLLRTLYNLSWEENTLAQLQLNWFYPQALSGWIGMYTDSPLSFAPVGGKVLVGGMASFHAELELYSRDLVGSYPDWATGAW